MHGRRVEEEIINKKKGEGGRVRGEFATDKVDRSRSDASRQRRRRNERMRRENRKGNDDVKKRVPSTGADRYKRKRQESLLHHCRHFASTTPKSSMLPAQCPTVQLPFPSKQPTKPAIKEDDCSSPAGQLWCKTTAQHRVAPPPNGPHLPNSESRIENSALYNKHSIQSLHSVHLRLCQVVHTTIVVPHPPPSFSQTPPLVRH